MTNLAQWAPVYQGNLSRLPSQKDSKKPNVSKAIKCDKNPVRVHVKSGKAITNETWNVGGYIYWAGLFGAKYEKVLEARSIKIPINEGVILLPPTYLPEPYLIVEIPYWIPDALLTVQKLTQQNPLNPDTDMPISNPVQFPEQIPPVLNTVGFTVNTIKAAIPGPDVLIQANEFRKGLIINNDSNVVLYLALDPEAEPWQSPIVLRPQGIYDSGSICYTGEIWYRCSEAASVGDIKILEFVSELAPVTP